jgi:hypothetical protein
MRYPNALLIQVLALITMIALTVGCGPTLLFPGGALEGAEMPAPTDWGFAEEISTIQLETRPEDPYSVNIWAVGLGDQLYVHAGANQATWVEHMEANPLVRAQVGERLFPLRASRVTSAEEFARFADVYETKYGTRPRNENIAEIYLYRLSAR